VLICASDTTIYNTLTATGDGGDGLFAAWSQSIPRRTATFVMHLDAWGQPAADPYWVPSVGGDLSSTSDHQGTPCASADGHGSVVVSWTQEPVWRSGTAYAVRTQRFSLEQTSSAKPHVAVPLKYALHPAFPNPFNPTCLIEFELAARGKVELAVYDVTGRRVTTLVKETLSAGEHSVRFDAENLASGVYFYRLRAGNFAETRKMVLLR